jgi:hypothetical protein
MSEPVIPAPSLVSKTSEVKLVLEAENPPRAELELAYTFGGDINSDVPILAWIQAILHNAPSFMTPEQLKDELCQGNTLFPPIDVSVEEVKRALSRGLNLKELENYRDQWTLAAAFRSILSNHEKTARQIESQVKLDWIKQLNETYKSEVIEFDFVEEEVWNLLDKFLNLVLRNYTQYISKLASMEADSLHHGLKDAIQTVVPIDHKLERILKKELPGFLITDNELRLKYIGRILSNAFYAYRTSVTEISSVQLAQIVRGQAIYLDTNILFALTGAEGSSIEAGVSKFVQMAKNLGFSLFYTSETEKEYIGTLKFYTKQIKLNTQDIQLNPLPWNQIAPGVIKGYFEEHAKNNLSPDEFFHKYSDLESILSRKMSP